MSNLETSNSRHTAFIGLGSNLGDRLGTLKAAVRTVEQHGSILAVSSVYETAPVGLEDQPAFLNAVMQVSTPLAPETLLRELLNIERSFGRDRSLAPAQGPRTLDLDLLLYGDQIIATQGLTVPHPSLHLRRFVLVPLVEIAPAFHHPVLDRTLQQLLHALPDTGANRRAAVRAFAALAMNTPGNIK